MNSLRKHARLALKGPPTVLLVLFVNPDDLLLRTALGDELKALAPAVISRRAGHSFLGYLSAQKQRLLGEYGQKHVKRRDAAARTPRGDIAKALLRGGVRVIVRAGSTFTPAWLCEESPAPTRP